MCTEQTTLLRYPNNYWMYCQDILYRHSLFFCDSMNFQHFFVSICNLLPRRNIWVSKINTEKCQELQFSDWPLEAGSKIEPSHTNPYLILLFESICLQATAVLVSVANFLVNDNCVSSIFYTPLT